MITMGQMGLAAISTGDRDSLLSERFSVPGPASPRWQIYKPTACLDASVAANTSFMNVRPVQGGAGPLGSHWFDDRDGILVYQLVTGNFTAISTCQSRNADGSGPPPNVPLQWALAGIAAHDPAEAPLPIGFNYVHVAFGSVNEDLTQLVCEHKNCVNSVSPYGSIPWPSGAGQLRMTRRGAGAGGGQFFDMYCRLTPQDAWTLVQTFDRTANPLPSILRVGMMAYDNVTPSAISGRYSDFMFTST